LVSEFLHPVSRAYWIFNRIAATIAFAQVMIVLEASAFQPLPAFESHFSVPFCLFRLRGLAPHAAKAAVVPRAFVINLALVELLIVGGKPWKPHAVVG
jgi:hypothetical protein